MMNLGERLRVCRENKDLKQIDVSKALHINNKTLSSYEVGTTMPDIETLGQLSQFYEVSLPWLLGIDSLHSHVHADIIASLERLNKCEVESVREFIEFLEFKKCKTNKEA